LENVTTRVVAFTEHGIELFEAGFSDYEATIGRREQTLKYSEPAKDEPPAAAPAREKAGTGSPVPRAAAAEDHRVRRAAARELEKKKRRAERLENEIADGEKDLFALREELRQAPGDDWEKLHVLSQKEQALKKQVDSLMTEWERLSTELARSPDAEGSEA
jgi:chromosome segregation ATPase